MNILSAIAVVAATLTLMGCGGGGTATPTPIATTLSAPDILLSGTQPYRPGNPINFSASSSDPKGGDLTYSWDFGDGTAAGKGASVTHSFAAANTYTVRVAVSSTSGLNTNASTSVVVSTPVTPTTNGEFVPDCAAPACGAQTATSYSGIGVGTWRYTNTSSTAAVINISIAMPALTSAKSATLLYSNGATTSAVTAPSFGVLTDPFTALADRAVLAEARQPLTEHDLDGHAAMLKKNRYWGTALVRERAVSRGDALPLNGVPAPSPAPALGTTKNWKDVFLSTTAPTVYATTAHTVCSLSSGRKVVFWLDPNATASGNVTSADIPAMAAAACGSGAGFERLNGLMGDFWAATTYTNIIQESPAALQDINIAIVNAPASAGWAGYFSAFNNFLSTYSPPTYANSNQALVFFINASTIKTDRNFATSTLLHEATHMTNFYQRSVARSHTHDTWLEETSAMMSEDIVTPVVLSGYNKMAAYRIPSYVATGGAVSYINWPSLSSGNYAMGGAFGAYLNRRYGLAIYKQLVTSCPDGATTTSYLCLDNLIKANGGVGLADDLAHMGAATFSLLSGSAAPANYGFPAKTDSGYNLQMIDMSANAAYRPATPAPLASGLTATTHTYQVDPLPIGKTNYGRNNVSIPANSTLLLVIK